jgi:hypothetical protein
MLFQSPLGYFTTFSLDSAAPLRMKSIAASKTTLRQSAFFRNLDMVDLLLS